MLLRVISSGEMISVKSEKSENGVLNKRILVLQELGGKYENCYVVTVLGNLATLTFEKNELVFATMRFQTGFQPVELTPSKRSLRILNKRFYKS